MRYEAPSSIEGAVKLLAAEAGMARVLAGGTDLLVQLRSGRFEPDLIVDLKRIDGMHDIREENGGYRIGAAVSGAELNEHAGLIALWPGVVEAAGLIGSTQVQGRATMSGNLCNASPPAVVGSGVSLSLDDDGRVASARVALGAVAAQVLLVEEAAAAIIGTSLEEAALEKLAKAASAACRPIDDKRGTKEFRIKVAGVLTRRAALIAYERARAK